VWGATAALVAGSFAVRGIDVAPPPAPEDAVEERPRILAPMQFLSGGAQERIAELDSWVSQGQRQVWKASRGIVFHLEGCPTLYPWMESTEGLRVERLLEELSRGTREDALAALALIFQLARSCDWDPGLRGRSEHAEKLGSLLAVWLRRWADPSATDPVLHEPALAATLAYGAVMRVAWSAPMVGHNQAPYARATAALTDLCGLAPRERTPFGRSLQARYERAYAILEGEEDRLRGLTEEAAILYPGFEGGCD
jgi:hypothetical protein